MDEEPSGFDALLWVDGNLCLVAAMAGPPFLDFLASACIGGIPDLSLSVSMLDRSAMVNASPDKETNGFVAANNATELIIKSSIASMCRHST